MSDKEDATASLGNSEVLSVQHSVGEAIPELSHRPEDGTKVPSAVRRQDAGDVFPDDPAGSNALSQLGKPQRQVATRVIQAETESCDGEGLAGGSAHEKVNCSVLVGLDGCEVAMKGDVGVVVLKDGAGEGVDFRKGCWLPVEGVPGDGGGFDAAADGEVAHHAARLR